MMRVPVSLRVGEVVHPRGHQDEEVGSTSEGGGFGELRLNAQPVAVDVVNLGLRAHTEWVRPEF